MRGAGVACCAPTGLAPRQLGVAEVRLHDECPALTPPLSGIAIGVVFVAFAAEADVEMIAATDVGRPVVRLRERVRVLLGRRDVDQLNLVKRDELANVVDTRVDVLVPTEVCYVGGPRNRACVVFIDRRRPLLLYAQLTTEVTEPTDVTCDR